MTMKSSPASRVARASTIAHVFTTYTTHFCTRERGGCKGMGGETCTQCWNHANHIADQLGAR
jgi:hypothetical protein